MVHDDAGSRDDSAGFLQVLHDGALLSSLQAGGQEVLVAAPRRFGSNIRRIGLTHETVGVDYLESSIAEAFPEIAQHLRDPHGALVRFVVDVLGRRTTQQSADYIAACIRRWKPDLLVHGANEFGGPIAAKAAGVPHMMLLAGLDNWFDRFGPVLRELDPFRNAAGLKSAEGDPEWLFAQGLILAEVPGWSARSGGATPASAAVHAWPRSWAGTYY